MASPSRQCCFSICFCIVDFIKFATRSTGEDKPRGLYFSKARFEGFTFGGAYIRRGVCTEGNLRFNAKLIRLALFLEGNAPFSLFYFVFEGNFQVQTPRGANIWRGDLTEGCLRYELGGLYLEGLIHGGGIFIHIFLAVYWITLL